MKAARVWILLGLAGCAAPPAPVSPADAKRSRLAELGEPERAMMRDVLKCFIRLDGPQGSAGALAVSPDGKILTAWHVVQDSFFSSQKDGAPPVRRSSFGGRYQDRPFSQPTLVAACPEQDLAVLDIGLPTPDHLSPSPRGFAAGERVFLVGASTGRGEFTECARMRATSDARHVYFLMDAPAFPGDSGGGVISQRGELLGVLVRATADAARVPRPPAGWDYISVMVPLPPRALEEILRARPVGKPTRLYLEQEPAEGKIDPLQFWKSIRFSAD